MNVVSGHGGLKRRMLDSAQKPSFPYRIDDVIEYRIRLVSPIDRAFKKYSHVYLFKGGKYSDTGGDVKYCSNSKYNVHHDETKGNVVVNS